MNNRRGFLLGATAALIAAPALVHSTSLMAISSPPVELFHFYGRMYSPVKCSGNFYMRTSQGFVPFDLVSALRGTKELRLLGPYTSRVRILDHETYYTRADNSIGQNSPLITAQL